MKRIAVLFPGQGSQYIGMGKKFFEKYEVVKRTFEESSDILGFNMNKLCFEGTRSELARTENTQPALLTTSIAIFRAFFEEVGIEPACCAGHSLGEYSALVCAGAVSFANALMIVRKRGIYMQEAIPVGVGSMVAIIGADVNFIEEECRNISTKDNMAVISNYNSPNQIVISGHTSAVNQVAEEIKRVTNARVVPLEVSAPFHCPLMNDAADLLRGEVSKYTYNYFKYPVITNVTAMPYKGTDIVDTLTNQIVNPVKWLQTMKYLLEQKIDTVIDIGPGKVLSKLASENNIGNVYSLDSEKDWEYITQAIFSNNDNEKSSMLKFLTRCLAIAVCTKNKNWNNEEYEKGVIVPYCEIKKLVEKVEKSGETHLSEDVHYALEMLKKILDTKHTPIEEQKERLNQLFSETGTHHLFDGFSL